MDAQKNNNWKMACVIAKFSLDADERVSPREISGRIIRETASFKQKLPEIEIFVKTFAHNVLEYFPRIHPWLYAKIFFVCRTPISPSLFKFFSADAFLTVDEENIIIYYKRRNGKGEFGGPKVRIPEGGAQTHTNEKQAELVAGGNAEKIDAKSQKMDSVGILNEKNADKHLAGANRANIVNPTNEMPEAPMGPVSGSKENVNLSILPPKPTNDDLNIKKCGDTTTTGAIYNTPSTSTNLSSSEPPSRMMNDESVSTDSRVTKRGNSQEGVAPQGVSKPRKPHAFDFSSISNILDAPSTSSALPVSDVPPTPTNNESTSTNVGRKRKRNKEESTDLPGVPKPKRATKACVPNLGNMTFENFRTFVNPGETMTEFLSRIMQHPKRIGGRKGQIKREIFDHVTAQSSIEKEIIESEKQIRMQLEAMGLHMIPLKFEPRQRLLIMPEILSTNATTTSSSYFKDISEDLQPFFRTLNKILEIIPKSEILSDIYGRINQFIKYSEIKEIATSNGTTETAFTIICNCAVLNADDNVQNGITLRKFLTLLRSEGKKILIDNYFDRTCHFELRKLANSDKKFSFPVAESSIAEALNFVISMSTLCINASNSVQ